MVRLSLTTNAVVSLKIEYLSVRPEQRRRTPREFSHSLAERRIFPLLSRPVGLDDYQTYVSALLDRLKFAEYVTTNSVQTFRLLRAEKFTNLSIHMI